MNEHVPLWANLASYVVAIIVAWLSSPPWQRVVKKEEAKVEVWADSLPATQHALVMAAISMAEKTWANLAGGERMARVVSYCNHFGVPVTPGQVQAVYDVMKAVGLFGKEAK